MHVCFMQGLSFLLYFGGEVQISDSNGNIFRNLSNAAYIGSFQVLVLLKQDFMLVFFFWGGGGVVCEKIRFSPRMLKLS